MKGVVQAGGTGSRLLPLTKVTNQRLLPVYDQPKFHYPIRKLVDAGIRLVVTGGKSAGDWRAGGLWASCPRGAGNGRSWT